MGLIANRKAAAAYLASDDTVIRGERLAPS